MSAARLVLAAAALFVIAAITATLLLTMLGAPTVLNT